MPMTRSMKSLPTGNRPAAAPSVIIVVMPGLLCRQASSGTQSPAEQAPLASVAQTLNAFQGNACGIVMDSDILRLVDHPEMAGALRHLMKRTSVHAVIHADRIDERNRGCSSLAIAQQFILRMGLNAGRDVIHLTGAGWDRTDQPTDLLAYAFRGLGFTTILDPELRLPLLAA